MKDLTIIVHDDFLDEVIDSLHEASIVEISDIERDRDVDEIVEGIGIPEIVSKCTEYEMDISAVLDVFQRVGEEKGAVQSFLNPEIIEKVKRKKKSIDEVFEELDELMEKSGNEILDLDDELSEANERINELELLKEDLSLIEDIDIELSHIGESEFTIFKLGTTSKPEKAKEEVEKIDNSYFFSKKVDENKYAVVAGSYIREKENLESALRQGDVRPVDLKRIRGGTPSEALTKIEKELKKLRNKKQLLIEELRDFKDKWEKEFLIANEELSNQRDKKEIVQRFGNTESTNVIKGWCAENKIEDVEKIVDKSSEGHSEILFDDPKDPDEVPVSLENPSWIRPFELLTNMFAPPRYDEVDPTFIVGPAFVLFFGLMLGDAIYGGLIVLTSVLLLRGIGKVEEGTRRFAQVLLAVGVSTIVFGFLTGGFLGPNKEQHPNILGMFGMDLPALLNTLGGEGPKILLVISLLIGLAYLNIGIFLSFVQHIHRGNKRHILFENVPWWLLQPAGFILLSGQLFGWYSFSPLLYNISWVFTIAGLGLLVYNAKGLSFFELTGFLGDFLSFARILALGLATSGIALTVNVLSTMVAEVNIGTMIGIPLIAGGAVLTIWGKFKKNDMKFIGGGIAILALGALTFPFPYIPFYAMALVVMIGGHLANAVLQALGSFVHSLRLQYVEFFGQFYEGGGNEFTPFQPKNEYTELEEDVIE